LKGFEMRTYAENMAEGHRLLGHDKPLAASDFFVAAATGEEEVNPTELAEARQMLGICDRLCKEYKLSKENFLLALSLSEDNGKLQGGILRDFSQLYLDLGRPDQAILCLEDSKYALGQSDAPAEEIAATDGFIGRCLLVQGKRDKAFEKMVEAHSVLRHGDNRHYELNNLVWLLMATPYLRRLRYAPRGIQLAREQQRKQRLYEILILTALGNTAYRVIKKRMKK
jgi:tetratricopeptide (TPR) repeat protein